MMSEGLPASSGYTELGDLLRQAGRSALSSKQSSETEFAGFKLGKLIGVGGMGASVYLAQSFREPSNKVAIKVLPESFALDQHLARRFRREAKVMQKIAHPNIVKLLDFGTVESGHHFIMMEYLEGGSLAELLSAEQTMDADRAVHIIEGVCGGLAALHSERISHRDIKPGNILLTKEDVAKLADFGLAKFLDPTSLAGALTRTGDHLGTTAYMAPEQLSGASSGDHRSDLYSLGVVLYQMLTGVVPHGSVKPPSTSRPELAHLDEVAMRAIDADPSRRYSSVIEFQHALSDAQTRTDRRRISRRTIIGGIVGVASATWILWPPARPTILNWNDVSQAQRTIGNANEFSIGLPASEETLRFRLSLGSTGYDVEALEVPEIFTKPVDPKTALACPGSPSLLARLVVKSVSIAIPQTARNDSIKTRSIRNLPSANAKIDEMTGFADACRWLDRIDATGVMLRLNDRFAIDASICPDYSSFSAKLGVGTMSIKGALSESAEKEGFMRIGCYQILRQPSSIPHPAVSAEYDFAIDSFEIRTPLEVVAALVAEPWLLPRLPALPWRPLYDGQQTIKDPVNERTVSIVEEILGNLS